jgi:hypothetical protein
MGGAAGAAGGLGGHAIYQSMIDDVIIDGVISSSGNRIIIEPSHHSRLSHCIIHGWHAVARRNGPMITSMITLPDDDPMTRWCDDAIDTHIIDHRCTNGRTSLTNRSTSRGS